MNKECTPTSDVTTPLPGAGRPALFNTPEELDEKVEEYFVYIEGDSNWIADPDNPEKDKQIWTRLPEPPTITGLCLFLGFESRQSFHDYGNKPEFSYTIKRARLRIENCYEKSLNFSRNPVAQIFALKNLGWADKQELDHTTNGQPLPASDTNIIVMSTGVPLPSSEKDVDV